MDSSIQVSVDQKISAIPSGDVLLITTHGNIIIAKFNSLDTGCLPRNCDMCMVLIEKLN
jgi:hypothetical protein